MYKKNEVVKSSLKMNSSYQGETIEAKVRRILNNKETITDGAPLIYTERKDGVQPSYNIRTDRWEVAVEAMDKVNASKIAQREARAEARIVKMKAKEEAEGQSIRDTGESTE